MLYVFRSKRGKSSIARSPADHESITFHHRLSTLQAVHAPDGFCHFTTLSLYFVQIRASILQVPRDNFDSADADVEMGA